MVKKGYVNTDMKLSDFDFELPEENIANFPMEDRSSSKLLLVPELEDKKVSDLPSLLSKGDLLVFNDSRVIPSRIKGNVNKWLDEFNGDTGGVNLGIYADDFGREFEVTFHKQVDDCSWWGFCKGSKKLSIKDRIIFDTEDWSFYAEVIDKDDESGVLFRFNEGGALMYEWFEKLGEMPLPPYIKREQTAEDKDTYQTVYAKNDGSVAAPTAGLHWTPELLEEVKARGVDVLYITLHVGAGTFQPVKTEKLDEHKMHSEYGVITQEAADKINAVKDNGGNVVAVGTTSLRLLESAVNQDTGRMEEFEGETDIFITPGYEFKTASYLMTNFHLPKSTLMMLVSAFAGVDEMKSAYKYAIENGYRFYSYGDSSLLSLLNKS